MIPEAAVEAAAKEIDAPSEPAAQEIARRALEAAAPHMLEQAWESGWANARANYLALHQGQEIPEWVTLRNPYGAP